MIETYDAEIFVVEKGEVTADVISTFIGYNLPHTYLVIMEQGRYVGFLDAQILKKQIKEQRFWCSDFIEYGEDLYLRAREHFANEENREFSLPVVNESGQILTFLVWNQQDERSEGDLRRYEEKIISLLEAGHGVELRDWDEYTARYWNAIQRDGRFVDNIRCTGRNWEMCGREPDVQEEEKGKILIDKTGIHYPVEEKDVTPLYCLSERVKKHKSKRVYIWINSHWTLYSISRLLFEDGYVVEGFCEMNAKRIFSTFLGKTVVDLEALVQQDVIIGVERKEDVEYLEQFVSKEKILRLADMYAWDFATINGVEFQAWGGAEEYRAFKKGTTWIDSKIVLNEGYVDNEKPGLLLWEYVVNKNYDEYKNYIKKLIRVCRYILLVAFLKQQNEHPEYID